MSQRQRSREQANRHDSSSIGSQQTLHKREEYSSALRALLMQPLLTPAHAEFLAVRRHADELRAWFARETGWTLHIERDCARLYKRPADLRDSTRGMPGFERRRYVLFCLACAVLERADSQITLRMLGERLLTLAGDRALIERGFTFALLAQHERRELVAVCHYLLQLGVLQRVAGDEEGFVRNVGETGDALYDVQRRVLAGLLAAVRGPSTWAAEEAPADLEHRLLSLVAEYTPDSDEGRRAAMRHGLSRRLLDDPVIYFDSLDADTRAYFLNQRGPMAARLCEASGLAPEQRAEGLALVDESGFLTDTAMPAEGTEAHVTLLVAEFLARRNRGKESILDSPVEPVTEADIAGFVREIRATYGRYWRKSARESGSEYELARIALERLWLLQLLECHNGIVTPLPALARFSLGAAKVKANSDEMQSSFDLFA